MKKSQPIPIPIKRTKKVKEDLSQTPQIEVWFSTINLDQTYKQLPWKKRSVKVQVPDDNN